MKKDNELKTRAQLIRGETSNGANTAERVGEHLEDMVDRLGKADIKQPDSTKPYRSRRPVVSFKFDDLVGAYNHKNWPDHFQAYNAARKAAGKHQYIKTSLTDNAIPGTLMVPSETPRTNTPLITATDLVFSGAISQTRTVDSVTDNDTLTATAVFTQTESGCTLSVWDALEEEFVPIDGTVSITKGSAEVTGSGTTFTTDVTESDNIKITKASDSVDGTETITSATGGFLNTGLAWNMSFRVSGEGVNNNYWFVIYSITDTVITTYRVPTIGGSDFSCTMLKDDKSGINVSLYRGRSGVTTWEDLAYCIGKGWSIAGHGRNHRNLGYRGGWYDTTDAELWDEIYTSRIDLNEKLSEILGYPYEVKHMVVPFGPMYDRTPTYIRQAGWESSGCIDKNSGEDYVCVADTIDPIRILEENKHYLVDSNNALTGTVAITDGLTTVTGSGTNFDGEDAELAVADIIAISDGSKFQVRRVTSIEGETSLTVDSAFDTTIASASIYKCANETPGDGLDIGFINYMVAHDGWLIVASHSPYPVYSQFEVSPYAAIMDYIDYMNEDGFDIQILDRGAAYEEHKPLLQIGTGFAVSDKSVMIRRADSVNFKINDYGGMVLGCPISARRHDDADIPPNRFTVYLDGTGNKLTFRVKYPDGTIKEGTVALT